MRIHQRPSGRGLWNRFAALLILTIAVGALNSCAYTHRGIIGGLLNGAGLHTAPVVPPPGMIFTSYKAPLKYNFNKQGEPTQVSMDGGGDEAETHYIRIPFINLSFAWGDASMEQANDGLKRADYADYEFFTVLTIYSHFQVKSYGE